MQRINGMKFKKSLVILLGLLFVLVVGGRYFFYNSPPSNKVEIMPSTSNTVSDISSSMAPPQEQQNTSTMVSAPQDTTIATCIQSMSAEVKANKTEYEKGTLLVTFKNGTSFKEASDTLLTYGITSKNVAESKGSYDAHRLITGVVASGDEFNKICLIKHEPSVSYAGLNVLFSLHE